MKPKRKFKNPKQKLTEVEVREIKKALKIGQTQKELAAFYGVSINTISMINIGTTWSHVK